MHTALAPLPTVEIGLVQLPIREGHWNDNLKLALRYMNRLAIKGAKCIILPEMWTSSDFQGNHDRRTALAQFTDHTLAQFQAWAKERHIYLIGSQLEAANDRYYNSAFVISPDGALAGLYRKTHLFALGGEKESFHAGDDLPFIFETPWGLWSVAICFDLRFPLMFRRLAQQGVACIIVPAQWPSSRQAHWLTLLRARAIENQCVMIGANRLGRKGNDTFHGASAVFDPWGDPVLVLKKHQHTGIAAVDVSQVEKIRTAFPCLGMDHPEIDQ